MTSELFVIGLSWRTASVGLREKLAFDTSEQEASLPLLQKLPGVGEVALVSTCNRVEVYGATPAAVSVSELESATSQVRDFLGRSRNVASEQLAQALYEHTDEQAVQHVFRVASALDSMVLGETQILGQLKDAFGVATRVGTVGTVLGRCLERAFRTAKRVRTETEVSRGAANVSSVAVELARKVFGELEGKTVLVVGAGKMSALAARHLRSAGAASIIVINRSLERAKTLAQQVDGIAREWDQLDSLFGIVDVVVSSTNAKEPILGVNRVKTAMKARRHRPVVIIDIAVPRDAAPAIGKLDGVYLFDIDDLQQVVAQNLKERAKEAESAERIVDLEVSAFRRWMQTQHVVPTIRMLRSHFDSVATAEIERLVQDLPAELTREQCAEIIQRLGDGIVRKLLHSPMNALKQGEQNVEPLVSSIQKLFALSSNDVDDDDSAKTAETAEISEVSETPETRQKNRGTA